MTSSISITSLKRKTISIGVNLQEVWDIFESRDIFTKAGRSNLTALTPFVLMLSPSKILCKIINGT